MKPNFALSLSFDGIGVLHRADTGWHLVGEAPLDSPDLSAELVDLHQKAMSLDPTGLSSKLIIPNGQIKYLKFSTDGINKKDIPQAVYTALKGATPYAVDDLAYDWSIDGTTVQVAAVARETLAEAESFAQNHQFNPISFVAIPEPQDFIGEPFFGVTKNAGNVLKAGQEVERDTVIVHVLDTASSPQPVVPSTTELKTADHAPADEPAFSSIRTLHNAIPDNAPKLSGATRNETTPRSYGEGGQPPEVVAISGDASHSPIDKPQAKAGPAEEAAFSSQRTVKSVNTTAQTRSSEKPPQDNFRDKPVFGKQPVQPVSNKPRHLGLILTAVLLIFLAGVAAWAAIFLEDGIAGLFNSKKQTRITELTVSAPEADPAVITTPPLDDLTETPELEPFSQPTPVELTPDEARARYAVTGIWQMAPLAPDTPSPTSLDNFYQTSIDPLVHWQDAVALPDAQAALGDIRPPTPNSPVHASTQFNLDDQGYVIATPDGALTPEGILVFAGRPEITPPESPERQSSDTYAEGNTIGLHLAALRPRSRPDNLSEQNERGTLGGRTKIELAALRPRLRPQSAQQAAEKSAIAALDPRAINAAVSLAVTDTDSVVDTYSTATPQAVSASLKPNTRPRNFSQTVKRSQNLGTQTMAASAAQKVVPRIPSSASVAKQATQRDAIRLRRVNLIGVYGTPSSRRALVLLANGRYQKVRVGDRLDGGKVAAIGDDELRYVKSGRNVVLKMPRG